MGLFDTVWLQCPKCNTKNPFQSKGGECLLSSYDKTNVPFNVLMNIDRHGPTQCSHCETWFKPEVTLKLHATPIKLKDAQPGDLESVPENELPINSTTIWSQSLRSNVEW